MILAAGLGTRLRPLTNNMPKPLVQLAGRPMISYALDLLELHGFHEVIINVHYLADQMEEFVKLENERRKKIKIFIQDEKEKILGSGGGVRKAADWLFEKNSSSLILNADNFFTPNLTELCKRHDFLRKKCGVETTLALMSHPEAGRKYTGICLDAAHELVTEFIFTGGGAGRAPAATEGLYHFPGVYVMERSAVVRMPTVGLDFNIATELWVPQAREKKIGAWIYNGEYIDLGTATDLEKAEKILAKKNG